MANFDRNTGDPVAFNSELDWGNSFHRSTPFPLDRTSLFVSYEDALAYATGGNDIRGLKGSSYPGQIITILSSDTAKPEVYVIKGGATKAERTLVKLGEGGGGGGGAGGYDAQINWRDSDGELYRAGETWVKYTNGMWDRDIQIQGSIAGDNAIPTTQIPDVTSAETIDVGYDVTSIGTAAFYECNNLKEVVVTSPNLTEVGGYAFYGCTGLEKIDFTALDTTAVVPTLDSNAFNGSVQSVNFVVLVADSDMKSTFESAGWTDANLGGTGKL